MRAHLELVCRLRSVREVARTVSEKALEVSLVKDLDKKVRFISPGSKRKLSIAMSLIGDARFIILDEPTSNLDLKSREKIWLLIKRISASSAGERAILLSTQHIEEAEILGTRICILSKGQKLRCDTPVNLKQHYGNGLKIKVGSEDAKNQLFLKHEKESSGIVRIDRNVQDALVVSALFDGADDE